MKQTSSAMDAALAPHSGQRQRILSSASMGWQGFGAEMFRVAPGLHRIPGVGHHRVGVHVGKPVKALCRCGGPRSARIQSHGDADIVPAGMPGEWSDDAECTILSITFSNAFVRRTCEPLGLTPSQTQMQPRFQFRDARFQHLAWAMLAELEADDTSDPLYAESLATAMLVRLTSARDPVSNKRRTLSARAAARVVDYIESHLDARLSLSELAALVDLSVPHFKALFRETMAVPVHRYVVLRRVERAKTLLLRGELSASQIALEVGFAHQSHMASWMKRELGVTPREMMQTTLLPREPLDR